MELMPFNFDRLPNGQVFISNLAGFHHFIDEQELLDLSDEQISAEQSNALESKLFITNESSSAIAPYALSSAFAKRLMNELAIRPIFMIVPTLRCDLKWFTEFGHLNRGDMLTSEQHRCHNEKKKFQRRV